MFEEILDGLDREEPEVNLHDTRDKPLFDGCPFIAVIIAFAMTEHLSWNALFHLLTLIHLHSPCPLLADIFEI